MTSPALFSVAALAGGPTRRDLAPGVFVHHHPGWLEPSVAREFFDRVVWSSPWTQHTIGGPSGGLLPRLTAWYGDDGASYRYSGIDNFPIPWTSTLEVLRRKVGEATSGAVGQAWSPNAALLNLYRTGMDSVGFHSDNEAALGHNPALVVVASVSLGAPRRFVLRSGNREMLGGHRVVYTLGDGDLLVMGPGVQAWFEHAVPKEPAVLGPRISITFRHVVGGKR